MFIKKLLITISIFLFAAMPIIADDNTQSNQINQAIGRKGNIGSTKRPLAPSNMRIYFSYDAQAGVCHFTLRPEIEYMSVEIENLDTHIMYFGEVDAADPVMYQSLDRGYYQITCTTDDGSIYAGEICIL